MRMVFFIGLLLFFFSCEKVSVDNTDPEIEVLLFNGSESLEEIFVDSELNIELFITDNEQLQEVLIKIENVSNDNLTDAQKLLDLIVFSDIDSKQFGQTVAVEMDSEDRAGRYQLLLQVVDANGNVDSRLMEFVLLNPEEQPYFEINSYTPPVVDGVITMTSGDSLVVDGWIVDDVGLGFIQVGLTGPETIFYNEVPINDPGFTGYAFAWMQKPKVYPDNAIGDYDYTITVTDSDGHMTFFSQPVQIE